jgi:hypothetical protein
LVPAKRDLVASRTGQAASGDLAMSALLIIVYLTTGPVGTQNMGVTQFYVPATQVFSNDPACETAKAAVLAQSIANMKIAAVCMALGQGQGQQ